MLEHLGEDRAARQIITAIESVLQQGVLPVDLGGSAKTAEVTKAIVKQVKA